MTDADAADARRGAADEAREVADAARVEHDEARNGGDAAAILMLAESIGEMVDVVISIGGEMRAMDERRTVEVAEFATGMRRLRILTRLGAAGIALLLVIAVWNHSGLSRTRSNAALLVECVTPGPDPAPTTGHGCWDRLHDPSATNGAVALIADDIYCSLARGQAKQPPPSDPTKPCRTQTDPSIYPGTK